MTIGAPDSTLVVNGTTLDGTLIGQLPDTCWGRAAGNFAYRADLARGVQIGRLVPFRYFGVRDEIDYKNIPWRNRRFDPEQLAAATQTERRMQPLWAAWQAHPGTRTLIFCCSVAHAAFAATWLAARGVRVARVYAAPGSDDRDLALTRLHRGELDAICAVDIFNEGVDVPALDRVVMLRPTESSVIFLQQLGRGLRAAPGKQAVTVLDFVGNHKIFLERLRTLLSLGDRAAALAALVATGRIELPNGCTVELALGGAYEALAQPTFTGQIAGEWAALWPVLRLRGARRVINRPDLAVDRRLRPHRRLGVRLGRPEHHVQRDGGLAGDRGLQRRR